MIRLSEPGHSVTLPRRLAAIFYDALLVFSLQFAVTLFLVLPFNQGHAVSSGHPLYQLLLLLIAYVYFGWQWTHGGQTLGMRAWRVRVVGVEAETLTWRQASLRFLLALVSSACLFLGFLWALYSENQQTWHDRLSNTYLIKWQPHTS